MPLEFDAEEQKAIARIVERYPTKAAALLPVLHLAQDKFGALPTEAQLLVAKTLDVAPTRVREVVTFYEMFHEHPEGQFHIELCTNIACHLAGADALMAHLQQRLGIEIGHQTEDGRFSLMEVECLASCGSGPMLKVGMDYYEGLNEAAVDALLEKLKAQAGALEGRPYVCGKNGPHVGPVAGFEPKLPVLPPKAAAPAPKAEAPKPEAPKPEAPKADAPKNEAPKAEPAEKTGAPKAPPKPPAPRAGANVGAPPAPAPAAAEAAPNGEENPSGKPGAALPSFDPPPLKSGGEKTGK